MSKMVTLKTDLVHRFNKSIIFGDTTVKFDSFGIADVMERQVESLLEFGLIPLDEEDIEKYAELRKKQEELQQQENVDVDVYDENAKLKIEISALKDKVIKLESEIKGLNSKKSEDNKDKGGEFDIESLSKNDLIELCKNTDFPKSEWEKLNKEDLKSYIASKL